MLLPLIRVWRAGSRTFLGPSSARPPLGHSYGATGGGRWRHLGLVWTQHLCPVTQSLDSWTSVLQGWIGLRDEGLIIPPVEPGWKNQGDKIHDSTPGSIPCDSHTFRTGRLLSQSESTWPGDEGRVWDRYLGYSYSLHSTWAGSVVFFQVHFPQVNSACIHQIEWNGLQVRVRRLGFINQLCYSLTVWPGPTSSLLTCKWGILTRKFPRSWWRLNEIRSSQMAWCS